MDLDKNATIALGDKNATIALGDKKVQEETETDTSESDTSGVTLGTKQPVGFNSTKQDRGEVQQQQQQSWQLVCGRQELLESLALHSTCVVGLIICAGLTLKAGQLVIWIEIPTQAKILFESLMALGTALLFLYATCSIYTTYHGLCGGTSASAVGLDAVVPVVPFVCDLQDAIASKAPSWFVYGAVGLFGLCVVLALDDVYAQDGLLAMVRNTPRLRAMLPNFSVDLAVLGHLLVAIVWNWASGSADVPAVLLHVFGAVMILSIVVRTRAQLNDDRTFAVLSGTLILVLYAACAVYMGYYGVCGGASASAVDLEAGLPVVPLLSPEVDLAAQVQLAPAKTDPLAAPAAQLTAPKVLSGWVDWAAAAAGAAGQLAATVSTEDAGAGAATLAASKVELDLDKNATIALGDKKVQEETETPDNKSEQQGTQTQQEQRRQQQQAWRFVCDLQAPLGPLAQYIIYAAGLAGLVGIAKLPDAQRLGAMLPDLSVDKAVLGHLLVAIVWKWASSSGSAGVPAVLLQAFGAVFGLSILVRARALLNVRFDRTFAALSGVVVLVLYAACATQTIHNEMIDLVQKFANLEILLGTSELYIIFAAGLVVIINLPDAQRLGAMLPKLSVDAAVLGHLLVAIVWHWASGSADVPAVLLHVFGAVLGMSSLVRARAILNDKRWNEDGRIFAALSGTVTLLLYAGWRSMSGASLWKELPPIYGHRWPSVLGGIVVYAMSMTLLLVRTGRVAVVRNDILHLPPERQTPWRQFTRVVANVTALPWAVFVRMSRKLNALLAGKLVLWTVISVFGSIYHQGLIFRQESSLSLTAIVLLLLLVAANLPQILNGTAAEELRWVAQRRVEPWGTLPVPPMVKLLGALLVCQELYAAAAGLLVVCYLWSSVPWDRVPMLIDQCLGRYIGWRPAAGAELPLPPLPLPPPPKGSSGVQPSIGPPSHAAATSGAKPAAGVFGGGANPAAAPGSISAVTFGAKLASADTGPPAVPRPPAFGAEPSASDQLARRLDGRCAEVRDAVVRLGVWWRDCIRNANLPSVFWLAGVVGLAAANCYYLAQLAGALLQPTGDSSAAAGLGRAGFAQVCWGAAWFSGDMIANRDPGQPAINALAVAAVGSVGVPVLPPAASAVVRPVVEALREADEVWRATLGQPVGLASRVAVLLLLVAGEFRLAAVCCGVVVGLAVATDLARRRWPGLQQRWAALVAAGMRGAFPQAEQLGPCTVPGCGGERCHRTGGGGSGGGGGGGGGSDFGAKAGRQPEPEPGASGGDGDSSGGGGNGGGGGGGGSGCGAEPQAPALEDTGAGTGIFGAFGGGGGPKLAQAAGGFGAKVGGQPEPEAGIGGGGSGAAQPARPPVAMVPFGLAAPASQPSADDPAYDTDGWG